MKRAAALAAAAALGLAGAAGAEPSPLSTRAFTLSTVAADGEIFMGIRTLGTLELVSPRDAPDRVHSLSALGWDDDERLLYALSDRGEILHLRPHFEADRLAGVALVARHRLRDDAGKPLAGRAADSEGLAVRGGRNRQRGDATLVVSFERRPRVVEFTPDGRPLARHRLPARFESPRLYSNPNRALEAVAWDPLHGPVTGPERALASGPYGEAPLVTPAGVLARYPLADTANSSLVALERLTDGRFLALERGYGLLHLPVVITLKHVAPPPADAGGERVDTAVVAVLDSSRGWSVDNFEGLARHRGRRFFMVSDDNDRAYQRTLLVFFEVLGDAPSPAAAAPGPPAPER